MAEFQGGMCTVIPITASGTVAAAPLGCGYAGACADIGAAGVVEIRDGSATGPLLDCINAAGTASYNSYFGAAPLWCNARPWVVLVSGALPSAFSIRVR